jgi:hypothetical protein
MTVVCCVCNRVKRGAGWVVETLEEAPLASHGYCPRCAATARLEIHRALLRRKLERIAASATAAA